METSELGIIQQNEFLPEELKWVLSENSIDYKNAPDTIELKDTQFYDFINRFRPESTQALVKQVKEKSIGSRQSRYPFWRTEFGKMIVKDKDVILITQLVIGKIGEINFPPLNPSTKVVASIHSHSSTLALSTKDVLNIFTGKLPIQLASTDDGVWLAFQTKQSIMPESEGLEEDFWQFGDYGTSKRESESRKARKIKNARQELLYKLVKRYGGEKLLSFFGEKLVERKTDPNEINDKGVALIQLYKLLLLSEKYKICIYFMSKNDDKFKNITKLEEIFPELETK